MSAKKRNIKTKKTPTKKVGVYSLPKKVRENINALSENKAYRKEMRKTAVNVLKKRGKKYAETKLNDYLENTYVNDLKTRFTKSISYNKKYTYTKKLKNKDGVYLRTKSGKIKTKKITSTKKINRWVDRLTGEVGTWGKIKKPFLKVAKQNQIKMIMESRKVDIKTAKQIYSSILKKKGQSYIFEVLGS